MFHLKVLQLRSCYKAECLRDVCAMQVRIFVPLNRAARMSSLTPPTLRSAQAKNSIAGSQALLRTAEAPAPTPAPSAALIRGQAGAASALHGTRPSASPVETEIKAARPSAFAAGLGLLKRSRSFRRTLPTPRRLPPKTPHTSRKPGTGEHVLAHASRDASAALLPEGAEAAACMQAAGMHGSASATSNDQLWARTAQEVGVGQHAFEIFRDADSVAVDLAEPNADMLDMATHGSSAMTEGDDGVSGTPSGTSTPPSESRATEDSISTERGGPAEPAKPLQAMPSLGAALARFTRTSESRADPNPEATSPQEALPLASALARLTRASLERVRQLRRTASDGRGRSGNLESIAGDVVNAEAGAAGGGQDGSGVLLLGGELLVTVVDAQVAITSDYLLLL